MVSGILIPFFEIPGQQQATNITTNIWLYEVVLSGHI